MNMDAVLLTPGCSDPLYRRAIRVSMGTVFQVPWAWLEDDIIRLMDLGFKTAAMALSEDSVSIKDERLLAEEKLAIVLGTEGDGLAEATIAHCDYTVRIPMTHGVDSLNVAAASAVAFWQLGQSTHKTLRRDLRRVLFLGFCYQFAGDVFRHKGKTEGVFAVFFNFFFDVFAVGGKVVAEAAGHFHGPSVVFHNFDAAKHNDTADVQRPLPFFAEALVINTEGGLVTPIDGINLVARLAAVEVDFPIFGAVPMVVGNAVGITLVPQHRKHPTGLTLQQFDAFFAGYRLVFSGQVTEHRGVLLKKL